MTKHPLTESVQSVRGVGPKLLGLLNKKGIHTLEDALYNLPRDYQDRSRISPINTVQLGTHVTCFGRVLQAKFVGDRRRRRFEAVLADSTGEISLVWFHAYPSLEKEFGIGQQFLVYGEVNYYGHRKQIVHPDYEKVSEVIEGKPRASANFGRIVPVYSESEGLHQKTIRRLMGETLKVSLDLIEDPLPDPMRERLALPGLKKSFTHLHRPEEYVEQIEDSPYYKRIIFEEFFLLQVGLYLRKKKRLKERGITIKTTPLDIEPLIKKLPFELTGDQKSALSDIQRDLAQPFPMARLVQGDVGSGKTVVALGAAHLLATYGFQAVIMAPTEILALQHFKNAKQLLHPLGTQVGVLTQSHPDKKETLSGIASGEIKVAVGTHALFQKHIEFKNLALVVVDEQHRFGVEQRAKLLRKGTERPPHLLMMTATPIPRTLALTVYGDLDLTVIQEKPANRLPIVTKVVKEKNRQEVYEKVRKTVARGEQVYIIYPLVEDSEKLDLKSATQMFERLSKEVFPEIPVDLLHGRMTGEQKAEVLKKFHGGKSKILVSTTVIEVGIDVPQATLMIIEHPERLGLSQLHQLRGRVGRGSQKSECILLSSTRTTRRLKVMQETEDGFKIAEADLKIRGPGEFLGTQQSGLPGFRVAHLVRDSSLLEQARREAERLFENDKNLSDPEHRRIRELVDSRWKEKIKRLRNG